MQRIEAQKVEDSQILRSKEISDAFRQGLQSAKHEVCIIVPWVSSDTIDEYANEFKLLAEKRVKVKLIFGIGFNSKNKKHERKNKKSLSKSQNGVNKITYFFRNANRIELFKYKKCDTHAKLFIVDNEWYLLGSMNLLSFNYSDREVKEDEIDNREELVEKIYNSEKIKKYKELFFKF